MLWEKIAANVFYAARLGRALSNSVPEHLFFLFFFSFPKHFSIVSLISVVYYRVQTTEYAAVRTDHQLFCILHEMTYVAGPTPAAHHFSYFIRANCSIQNMADTLSRRRGPFIIVSTLLVGIPASDLDYDI